MGSKLATKKATRIDSESENQTQKFHPENVIPTSNWIWVFGAKEGGKHSKGTSKIAHVNFRAKYGCDSGPTANAYAVTCQDKQHNLHPLSEITKKIDKFLSYAVTKPKENFFVTRIGFVEGLKDEEIAPLFQSAPCNCSLPEAWKPFLTLK